MVGHTGSFTAARIAVEVVDLCLGRILEVVDEVGGVLVVTADHGNADEMYEKVESSKNPKPKTSHTLNPVPFIIYDKLKKHEIAKGSFGLANVAPTIVELLGIERQYMWEESMLLK